MSDFVFNIMRGLKNDSLDISVGDVQSPDIQKNPGNYYTKEEIDRLLRELSVSGVSQEVLDSIRNEIKNHVDKTITVDGKNVSIHVTEEDRRKWDANSFFELVDGNLHVKEDRGLYTGSFISAYGLNSAAGGDSGSQSQGAGVSSITVDSALDATSENPVQNKVVKAALDGKADTNHTHDIAIATTSSDGLLSKEDKAKLDSLSVGDSGGSSGGGGSVGVVSITVDSALSSSSTNPVQNRVITAALNDKADSTILVDNSVMTQDNCKVLTLKNGSTTIGTFDPSVSNEILNIEHDHDERYYTENEVNTLLAQKQSAIDTLTSLCSTLESQLSSLQTMVSSMKSITDCFLIDGNDDVYLSNKPNSSTARGLYSESFISAYQEQ